MRFRRAIAERQVDRDADAPRAKIIAEKIPQTLSVTANEFFRRRAERKGRELRKSGKLRQLIDTREELLLARRNRIRCRALFARQTERSVTGDQINLWLRLIAEVINVYFVQFAAQPVLLHLGPVFESEFDRIVERQGRR